MKVHIDGDFSYPCYYICDEDIYYDEKYYNTIDIPDDLAVALKYLLEGYERLQDYLEKLYEKQEKEEKI